MNNKQEALLRASKNVIVDAQERRKEDLIPKITEEEKARRRKIENFVKVAEKNNSKFDSEIADDLITMMKRDADLRTIPGISNNCFYGDDYHISFSPDALALPVEEDDRQAPYVDSSMKDKDILNYCRDYNNTKDQELDLYVLANNGGRLYSVPVLFGKSIFEDLGFTIHVDGSSFYVVGDKEACIELLKLVTSPTNCFDHLVPATYQDASNLLENDRLVKKFKKDSQKNTEIVSLDICKRILECYQNDSIDVDQKEIVLDIPVEKMMEDGKIINDLWFKIRDFHEVCDDGYPHVLTFKFEENGKTIYRPVIFNDLVNALNEICTRIVYVSKPTMRITTNREEFEKLVLNTNKKKSK